MNKITKSAKGNVYFLEGDDDGVVCYFYLKANPVKQVLLEKMQFGNGFDLKDYGTVLTSGYGQPSKHIKLKMHDEYGFAD